MKSYWLSFAAVPLLAAPILFAQTAQEPAQENSQQGSQQNRGGLTRVDPQDDARAEGERFDAQAWKQKLSTDDLDQRERELDRLIDLARRDEDARAALEGWSKDRNERELAWTSRLALRALDRGPRRLGLFGPGGQSGPGHWEDFHSRFENLHRQFGDVDSLFGDLQRQLDEMFGQTPGLGAPGGLFPDPQGGGTSRSRAESFTMESGPDGVTVKVTEEVDGESHTREYTADSLEELLEANPELRDRIGIAGPGATPFGGRGLFRTLPEGGPRSMPTDKLGVYPTPAAPERREELGLDPEVGMHIERVEPGTIAEVLGIKRGDVLVEINGTRIHGRDDILRAMRERKPDSSIAVVIYDAKGQRRTLTWNPSDARPERASSKDSERNF